MVFFHSFILFIFLIQSDQTSNYSQAEQAFRDGDYQKGLEFNRSAIELFKLKGQEDSLVIGYIQRANLIWDGVGIQEAEQTIDSALYFSDLYEVKSAIKAAALNKKGQILVQGYRLKEASKVYKQAENMLGEEGLTSRLGASLFNNISWLYLNLQNLEIAFDYAQKSLKIQKEIYGEDDDRLMGVYQSLGLIANDRGDYENAEFYSQKLYDIGIKNLSPDHPTMALVHNQLAIVYEAQFQYKEALQHLIPMVKITQKHYSETGNPQFLAIAYNNTGNIYHQLGEFSLAEPYFEKALELHSKNFGVDDLGLVQPVLHLASTKIFLDKFDAADSLFHLAYAKQNLLESENKRQLADMESQMGDLYSFQNQSVLAIDFYRKSLQHYAEAKIEESFMVQETKNSLGLELLKVGKYSEALKMHKGILQVYRKLAPNNRLTIASKLNYISNAYLAANQIQEAKSYSDSTFFTLLDHKALSDPNIWMRDLPPGTQIADFILVRIRLLEKYYAIDSSEAHLEEIVLIANLFSENFEKSIIGLRTQESLTSLALKQKKIFDKGIQAAWILAQKKPASRYKEEAFYLSEMGKGVLLRLSENNLLIDKKTNSGALYKDKKWRDHISQLNSMFLNQPETGDSLLQELTKSLESYRNFQDSLAKSEGKTWKEKYSIQPFDLEFLRKHLISSKSALIEFSVTDESVFTFVLDEDELRFFRTEKSPIIEAISNLRGNELNNLIGYKKEAFLIFERVLKASIADKNYTKLLVVPDADLYAINFEALITEETGSRFSELAYLIKDMEISYLLSGSTAPQLFTSNQNKGKPGLFVSPGFTPEMKEKYEKYFAENINEDPIHSQLMRQPFSIQTTKMAYELIGGELLEKDEANERNFLESAPQSTIIHLSSHAETDHISPLQSRIFLAKNLSDLDSINSPDGIIHAFEVYGMQLDAELAVLSACNTGVGKFKGGEGVISMAHSFLYAGCSAVMMSMWAIDEKTSSQILSSFYEFLESGDSKSAALRAAKLEFLESAPDELAHPYYWAGLGIIGDPSPIKRGSNSFWIVLGVCILSLTGLSLIRKYYTKR